MKQNKKKKIVDALVKEKMVDKSSDSLISEEGDRSKNEDVKSMLFSRGKKSEKFFTEDSRLYITPKEFELIKQGVQLDRKTQKWDSLSSRVVKKYVKYAPENNTYLKLKYASLIKKYQSINEDINLRSEKLLNRLTMAKVWNASMVGAILFGMVTMSMIYKYLGTSASAEDIANYQPQTSIEKQVEKKSNIEEEWNEEKEKEYIDNIVQHLEEKEDKKFRQKAREMVKGYPIEKMLPYILEKDRTVAAFLIGIAKKESNWGKRIPVLNGQDCFNYWGYRGKRRLMGSGGHTCFNSRKDAVDTVGRRIKWLVENKNLDTPEEMVVWKCGYSCDAHSNESVRKWISDVEMYFKKLK